jgi:hypothetical protein
MEGNGVKTARYYRAQLRATNQAKVRRTMRAFMERYLAGEVGDDAIDDYIDAWHTTPTGKELHEFLGMTLAEYGQWLANPDALRDIASKRRRT